MMETATSPVDKLVLEEALRLLNGGYYAISALSPKLHFDGVNEQVTAVSLSETSMTVSTRVGICTINNFLSLSAQLDDFRNVGNSPITIYNQGPKGGPSPAMTMRLQDNDEARASLRMSCVRVQALKRQLWLERKELATAELLAKLKLLFVGLTPVDVLIHEAESESGFALVYADGTTVTINLRELDIESSDMTVNDVKVAPIY